MDVPGTGADDRRLISAVNRRFCREGWRGLGRFNSVGQAPCINRLLIFSSFRIWPAKMRSGLSNL
jgi:hypothetical protein